MAVRGIRGAISVENNAQEAISQATRELIGEIMEKNHLDSKDIASVLFSVTSDLDAQFPARAAREMGWENVPMMCTWEMDVPGSIRGIIRVMIHWNTESAQDEIKHIYLKRAAALRPDLV
ncbi:chorismate mutase [Dehalobacterium formicoaceticum]|uniref:chorismate mutase n=1 Tax=Dehalobacterium formicoaceticum TaxID=51515 RepID=A0ABT1Y6Y5_9FIRM|nr:chorismate mutase [Dehalobacterium formicoaceticum]MCR6545860.1 chorismate mutase [Dehalobacterium formicoaceticum]